MKIRQILMVLLFCSLLLDTQCNEDDGAILSCDLGVVVDSEAYIMTETNNYTVGNMFFNRDCLFVEVTASGCRSDSWQLTLIDSGNIAESLPNQRYLKLALTNNETCSAVFTTEESFNLAALRINGVNEIVLNIEGFPEQLLYTY
ncbi:hypothetical protein [Winogradskyella bathintestinalis]|uniref:Lipocalin-like domain-containing protein n=1 Tax=Winogradskyella bathintestinalis TaxID=3035208 RepID=A0ABT7ZV80_9FLAO|nr:hypothetical protein [Winogradskyella bathintestinalis]MDN3492851.1 hypothetical protein [Winogradskyella bathintestinalis]